MKRWYRSNDCYRPPRREEQDGGGGDYYCVPALGGNFDDCNHPGLRHPDDMGDLIACVSCKHMVWDGDGDLVISVAVGYENPIGDREIEEVPLDYWYLAHYRWVRDTWETNEAAIARMRQREKVSQSSSTNWSAWLIEDDQTPDTMLLEVRERLGLKEEA